MSTVSYTVLDQLFNKFAHLLFLQTNETWPSVINHQKLSVSENYITLIMVLICLGLLFLFQCLFFWLNIFLTMKMSQKELFYLWRVNKINDLWLHWYWWLTSPSPVTTCTDNWKKMKKCWGKKKQVKINVNSAIILSHFIKKGAHNLFKCNLIQSFIIFIIHFIFLIE